MIAAAGVYVAAEEEQSRIAAGFFLSCRAMMDAPLPGHRRQLHDDGAALLTRAYARAQVSTAKLSARRSIRQGGRSSSPGTLSRASNAACSTASVSIIGGARASRPSRLSISASASPITADDLSLARIHSDIGHYMITSSAGSLKRGARCHRANNR